MSERRKIYESAVSSSQKAVQADQRKQFKEALQFYEESIERFLLFVRDETNVAFSQQIRSTINNYMTRAEYLKEKVDSMECYERGVQLINEAIQFDGLNDYQRAYEFYSEGIELILRYTQFKKEQQTQSEQQQCKQIYKQLESYLDRAEIMKRMMKNLEETHNQEQKEAEGTTGASITSQSSSTTTAAPAAPRSSLCVLCLSNSAVYAMVPCGHVLLCEECLSEQSEELTSCYVCRTQLTPPKYLKIYLT